MDIGVYEVIATVITFVIGLIVGNAVYKVKYMLIKSKIRALRQLIDAIDNALADDKVTKEEVKEIVDRCKGLLIGLKK